MRCFVGFGARVAEEGLPAEKASFRQHLGPAALSIHVPGVGNVNQRGDVLLNGLDNRAGQWPSRLQPQPGRKSR